MSINPITRTDYPDPDVIRVGDTYYMISTTMYFMPGGVILRSFDLVNWEIASYIFDELDGTDSEKLIGASNYGKGMWAATLHYHDGKFYVAFVSHGRKDTHLFIADDINGPWEHRLINEYFHDCSLLFDDDGRVFIVSGNTDIRLTELTSDLSSIKDGGIDKVIISDDKTQVRLGYEGSHLYKINGKYIITLIHWPNYNGRRTEAVFMSDKIDGPYIGKDVMSDDMNYYDMGVAQGGLVDTPDGDWYAILFQDSGAVGRVPVLMPITWDDEGWPVFGVDGLIPADFKVKSTRPDYKYQPLFISDDFTSNKINPQWQWNHAPDNNLWTITSGQLQITTNKTSVNPVWARNTLTQRMCIPGCSGSVTIDASKLNDGDYIGLIALEGCYGFIGLMKEDGKYYLVKLVRTNIAKPFEIGFTDTEPGELVFKEEISTSKIDVKLSADFRNMSDTLRFFYKDTMSNNWTEVGDSHKLKFGLDYFTGARFGLTVFSTKVAGGTGVFEQFVYECEPSVRPEVTKSLEFWSNIHTRDYQRDSIQVDNWLKQFDEIIDNCDLPILDLGCGSGNDTLVLINKGKKVFAIDQCSNAIAKMQKNFPELLGSKVCNMLDDLDFEDGMFGIVIADLTLHYFKEADTKRILDDIKRILVPGGHVLIRVNSMTDVNHGAGKGTELEHHLYETSSGMYKRFFDEEDVLRIFRDFEIVSYEEQVMVRYSDSKELFVVCLKA